MASTINTATKINVNTSVEKNKNVNTTNTNESAATEDSKTIIANIESAIKTELAGNNNNGQPYYQWTLADQRMTADEEYLAVIRYNADTYGIEGGYRTKMQREKDEIIAKATSVSKAIMELGYPMGIILFEAYTGGSNPQYKIEMEKAALDQVDWTKDASILATTLPSTWQVLIDNYAFYLSTNSSS